MMHPRWLIVAPFVALVAALGIGPLRAAEVSGVVFEDTNRNGTRDAGERGVAGIAVSNQDTVVTTDASGAFRLPSAGTGVIFVSTPNAYRPVGPWWRPVSSGEPLAFALTREQARSELTFIHASDTHLSPASLPHTQRLRALVDSIRPGLLLITGDLVRDALRVGEAEATGYYELFARERNAFRTPVFTVPGNHENFGIERDTSHVPASHPLYGRGMYHHYFGPDYYSFTRGGVHFVGLNTVDIDDKQYYGHVDSLQLAWLERDLALVPADMPVVTFDHIPFVTTFEGLNGYNDRPPAPSLITVNGKTVYRHTVSNAGDVLAVLRKHRYVLALGGHLHATERIEYEMTGVRTRFNQVSAIVGPSEGAGLESISGVTLYRVKNGEIDAGRFIPLEPAK
ncbi:MAG TPA: metallophosphoesterase [Gemmatimonadaceae bacterium]|nr:metallophosphoesterase [Gemmatimonadaceae bacterium]